MKKLIALFREREVKKALIGNALEHRKYVSISAKNNRRYIKRIDGTLIRVSNRK